MSHNTKIRVLIAGLGNMGLSHALAHHSLPDSEIVGLVNRSYVNLPEADYKAALLGAGLPEPIANLLADSDVGASKGGLFDEQRQLSALIGRPTTSLAALMQVALK